jgi:poly-gamma-glutamate system protein
MNAVRRTIALCTLSLLCVGAVWVAQRHAIKNVERADAMQMRRATAMAAKWFNIVLENKDSLGLVPQEYRNTEYLGLLGDEYSSITTTLGSLDAKETALNPEFAALVVRMKDSIRPRTSA